MHDVCAHAVFAYRRLMHFGAGVTSGFCWAGCEQDVMAGARLSLGGPNACRTCPASQVVGGSPAVARTRRKCPGGVLRPLCILALWLKVSGAVDHVWEGLGGRGGFDATCGFPGEGPLGMEDLRSCEETKGKKDRKREARGFLKLGTTNVTSWKSFMDEFALEDSELRKGHVWAVQEHKLVDEHACAQAQDDLAQYGWKGFFTPAGKGPKGHPSGGSGGSGRNG